MSPLLVRVLACTAAAPAVGLVLAALAPTGWWAACLALHWAPHLAILSLPLWCWIGRRPWPSLAMAGVMGLALWPWLAAAYTARASSPSADSATAVVANLYVHSPTHAAAIAGLDGDLVALIEALPEDRERLRHDPRWPQQRWLLPPGYGATALLSRWPMRAREIELDHAPGIDARVEAPWGEIRVIVLHTRSPSSPRNLAHNLRQLAELAGLAETEPGPLLVLGDLNASPGDEGLRILRAAGLKPPHGGQPRTWPSWFGACGIAIDHALVHDLALGEAQAISLPGSDHRGLRVRFSAQAETAPPTLP